MGDPNASIPTPQPVLYRPMFGALRAARGIATSVTFVSQAALAAGVPSGSACASGWSRSRARRHRQADMVHNDATARIEVDPETYEVRADGELLTCEPARCCPWRSAISCSDPDRCAGGIPWRLRDRHLRERGRRPDLERREPRCRSCAAGERRQRGCARRRARGWRSALPHRRGAARRRRPALADDWYVVVEAAEEPVLAVARDRDAGARRLPPRQPALPVQIVGAASGPRRPRARDMVRLGAAACVVERRSSPSRRLWRAHGHRHGARHRTITRARPSAMTGHEPNSTGPTPRGWRRRLAVGPPARLARAERRRSSSGSRLRPGGAAIVSLGLEWDGRGRGAVLRPASASAGSPGPHAPRRWRRAPSSPLGRWTRDAGLAAMPRWPPARAPRRCADRTWRGIAAAVGRAARWRAWIGDGLARRTRGCRWRARRRARRGPAEAAAALSPSRRPGRGAARRCA